MSVVNEKDVPPLERSHGDKYASTTRRLGAAAGGRRLNCSRFEVPPGKTAFPFHAHWGIEEALYVLSGTGTLRLGEQQHEVGPGTYAAFPPGREHAHQLINSGDEPLVYLCLSADADPDAVEYPDSGKVGVMAGFDEGWPPKLYALHKRGTEVGYYDDEE